MLNLLEIESPIELFKFDNNPGMKLMYFDAGIVAGTPEAIGEFEHITYDINRDLIKNPAYTFFARIKTDNYSSEGIFNDDLLVIDKSLNCKDGSLALCMPEGKFILRRIKLIDDKICMVSYDKTQEDFIFDPNVFDLYYKMIFGFVTHSIRKL